MKHKTYSFTVMKTVDGFEATIPKIKATVKGNTFDEVALEAERALATWLMERDKAKQSKRKK